jgi:putative transposase
LGGYTYHVRNRGNARAAGFNRPADYNTFIETMGPKRLSVILCESWQAASCPRLPPGALTRVDGDLRSGIPWLLTTKVGRDLRHDHSSQHIWQGRFKAFPTEEDEHRLTVLRLRDIVRDPEGGKRGGKRGHS